MRNRAINDVKHPPSCGVHGRNLQLHSLIAIAALVLLLTSRAAAQAGTTYYVSPSGSDTNPGTIGAPWRTIQHAAGTIHAGATVDVRAGVYNESVSIAVSGSSSSAYIVFQSYPGELAIVDGTGVSCCGGSTKGLFNITNQSYLIISGFEIRHFSTTHSSQTPGGVYVNGAG